MKRQPISKPASAHKASQKAGRDEGAEQASSVGPYERVFPEPAPTRSTLALLAAVVSIGTQKTPLEAIGQAYHLWSEADEHLRRIAVLEGRFDSDPVLAEIVWPADGLPLTLDALLAFHVPGANADERMAFFRRCFPAWQGLSQADTDAEIQRLKSAGLTKFEWASLAEHCLRRQQFERAEANRTTAEQGVKVRKNLRAAEDFKASWPSKSVHEQLEAHKHPPEWVSFLSDYVARSKRRSCSERQPKSLRPAKRLLQWWKEQQPARK